MSPYSGHLSPTSTIQAKPDKSQNFTIAQEYEIRFGAFNICRCENHIGKSMIPGEEKWFLPLLLPIQNNICPKVSNMWPFPSSFACFFCFLHVHPEKVKVWPTPFTLCHRDTSAQDSLKDGTVSYQKSEYANICKNKETQISTCPSFYIKWKAILARVSPFLMLFLNSEKK